MLTRLLACWALFNYLKKRLQFDIIDIIMACPKLRNHSFLLVEK